MADQQANAVTAAFPSPPSFYEHFTQDNIERIEALRKEAAPATGQGSKEPVRLDDLSDDLRYLQPPEPPAEGTYRVFGDFYTVRALIQRRWMAVR
jgi:mediator of RNA polymerase II transcription subunit 7